MPKAESHKLAAPYMSYGVFTKSIETFTNTTVPTGAIDRRVLHEFSGADYGALISGLRFLGLIDDERKATQSYRTLVNNWKDQPKFKANLCELLGERYKPIVGNLNLTHGTSAELEKAFKDYGVSAGQMLTKTIRFFLKAAAEAGYTLSPFLTAPKPRTQNVANKKPIAEKGRIKHEERNPADAMNEGPPQGFERLSLPGIPNSFIQYPVNLTEAQCQILEAMIGVLRKAVEARTGGKDKRP